jgi:hypothetical protein
MRMNVHLALNLPIRTTHNDTIGDAGRCAQTMLNGIKSTFFEMGCTFKKLKSEWIGSGIFIEA